MTKRQLIDEICTMNHSAAPSFLARFESDDLQQYLDHLHVARRPRLTGNPRRYDKYFQFNTPSADSDSAAEQEAPASDPVDLDVPDDSAIEEEQEFAAEADLTQSGEAEVNSDKAEEHATEHAAYSEPQTVVFTERSRPEPAPEDNPEPPQEHSLVTPNGTADSSDEDTEAWLF